MKLLITMVTEDSFYCYAGARKCLLTAVISIFMYQTYNAIEKYQTKSTTITYQTKDERQIRFPGISLCPFKNIYDRELRERAKETNFTKEIIEVDDPGFFLTFMHHNDIRKNVTWDGDLPPNWQRLYTVLPDAPAFVGCYSYTSTKLVEPGYNSMLFLSIFAPNNSMGKILVYIHPPGDNLLVGNRIHGRDVFFPNAIPGDSLTYEMHEITLTKYHYLSKPELPCHRNKDKDSSIRQCLESHVEKEDGCILPWNVKGVQDDVNVCKNSSAYKNMISSYLTASEQAVYEYTGCYGPCDATKYRVQRLMEDKISDEIIRSGGLDHRNLHLFVTSGGVEHRDEVLVFDFGDLVANVGGYLGLMLGTSIISMADTIHRIVAPYFKPIKVKNTS